MANTNKTTKEVAWEIRRIGMETCLRQGGGNLCQCFSTAEALAGIFNDVLNIPKLKAPLMAPKFTDIPGKDDQCPDGSVFYGEEGPDYDKFFFSPPHYSTALYCALVAADRLSEDAMKNDFDKDGEVLVQIGEITSPGYESMSGSLGQAISNAVGYAIMRKKKQESGRVFVYIGDGECESGQTWEAIQCMKHYKLNNMTVFVDMNGYQCDDTVEVVMNTASLAERFEAFGMRTYLVDGHDEALIASLANQAPDPERPTVILCDTNPWQGFEDLKSHEPRYHYITFSAEEKVYYTNLLEQMKKERA